MHRNYELYRIIMEISAEKITPLEDIVLKRKNWPKKNIY